MHNVHIGKSPRYLADIVQPMSYTVTRSGLRSLSADNQLHHTSAAHQVWTAAFLIRLWTKVHKIFGQRRGYFVLSDDLARLSMPRFFLRIFAMRYRSRRKTEQMVKFLAPNFFCGRDDPNIATADCYCDLQSTFGKVWLSSVCWSPSAKPGNEVESGI